MERDQCTSVPGYHSRSGISFQRSLLHHRTAVHERITDGDRTAGTGILKPCNVQYLQFLQAWKNCRTYITWILLLLCSWRTYRRYCCIRNENSWIFQRKTSGRGSYRGCNTGSVQPACNNRNSSSVQYRNRIQQQ